MTHRMMWTSGETNYMEPTELATLIGHDGHTITAVTYDLITCSCGVTLPTADFMTKVGYQPPPE